MAKTKKAEFTAKVLNEFLEKARKILKNHPLNEKRKKEKLVEANYLLVRGAGQFKKTLSFKDKYKLKSCCVAGGKLYKGIAKILGMKIIEVKGANSLATTNLKGKFSAVKKSLTSSGYDFSFLHIKATDNLAEDGNFKAKKDFIEKIDKEIKPIMNLKNTLVVVTADHSTCSLLKRHCSEPMPLLIYPFNVSFPAGKIKFSERFCKKGKLGKIKQLDLMLKILLYRKN